MHYWERMANMIVAHLGVIGLASAKQGIQRVIPRNDEASKIHKKLAADVEEDQKEVDPNETKKGIDFGDGGLLLKIIERGIFGQLIESLAF